MATDQIERLRYFQHQYLGAVDFEDQQIYHRDMRRRHNLGQHTWGIITGLELVEQPQPGPNAPVDVYVLPGMAVDGFGREIIVPQPTLLDPLLFDSFGNLGHRAVWIAYDEERARRPAPGYEQCDVADQFGRVLESFRFDVEPKKPTHDPVMVGGKAVQTPISPPPAPPAVPPATVDLTIPYDESVPYQEFPDDDTSPRWLVRLGSVNWDGVNIQFMPAAAGKLSEGRCYAGAVAAEVLAPAGSLLLKDRGSNSPLAAAAPGVTVTVEGSVHVKRDVQIHGGKLDFRDATGGGGEMFTASRREAGGAGGIDLRVKLGDATDGKNRLVVGSGATDDKVLIADNGDTDVRGNLSVRTSKNLLVDGGQLRIQKLGEGSADWGLKVNQEDLQFIEPDDGDRVVFEVLDVGDDLSAPVLRLHGQPNATLSSNQLVDLTDGGITTLHTHVTATTTQRGMVEIAENAEVAGLGDSGARLVVAADDTRLLTQGQKNELTNGVLTSLHHHPNGILNNVRIELLFADNGTSITTINLGSVKRVVAFIYLSAMDPRADFDSGDGFFADIFKVDGATPPGISWNGGAHLGAAGSDSNLFVNAYAGTAQSLTFRLRSTEDASVWAAAVVHFENL